MNKAELNSIAIIIGGNHHNTLGVVRSLGEKGIHPYVYLVNKNLRHSFIFKSKYIAKGSIIKNVDELVTTLIDTFSNYEIKPTIICTSDPASSFVDLNYDILKKYFLVPNGKKQGYLTELMQKDSMLALAQNKGLTIADTWYIDNDTEIDKIKFPCITKPLSSISGTKANIKVCHSKKELLHFINQIIGRTKLQVQKYIDKDFEYQLIGCSLNGGEKVIIPGFTEIIRSSSTTNTGFLKYRPISELNYNQKACIDFIKGCNYSGLFSLEFIRGKDGVDYFLEINFRNDGNAYAVTAAGVNLPYIWLNSQFNEVIEKEIDKTITPILVMPELVDIFQVYKKNITINKWLQDLKATDSFIYYNKSDKKPFFFKLNEMIKQIIFKGPKKLISRLTK